MWPAPHQSDILIFLQCSFENSTTRRKLNWLPADHEEQMQRLSHALEHADFVIDTNSLSPAEVLTCALEYLESKIS